MDMPNRVSRPSVARTFRKHGLLALAALAGLAAAAPAHAAEAIELPKFQSEQFTILMIVFISALVALGYGVMLMKSVLAVGEGTKAMQDVAKAIQEGAMAYLGRQIKTMIWLVLALAVLLAIVYQGVFAREAAALVAAGKPAPDMSPTTLGVGLAIAFVLGVTASYGAGFVGMWMAVRGNVRVASEALRSYKGALETAFRAGAVAGMFTVGFGLLGACAVFFIFQDQAMKVLVGFGFGGALAALFMRVGGGIFTKAADVGADLVGKVEQGIPEDDPRNAATIADNVGDNVGDCAGMAADIFESYEVTLVAAIILGAAVGGPAVMKLIMYPLLVRAVGVVASIVGIVSVKGKDDENMDPMKPISIGYWIAAAVAVIGFGAVTYFFMNDPENLGAPWSAFFIATLMGIFLALVIERLTEHFTATEKGPVTEIANASKTGPATIILSGLSSGLESSVWSVLAICATIFGSVLIFGGNAGLAAYGIALAGLGLLTTTGYMLAMDTYGPISDNANGIFEMSGALEGNPAASRIVAKLDAVGNTTKALTKGLAIATAVIAATALFRSFMADAGLLLPADLAGVTVAQAGNAGIHLDWPEVFIGFLIGGAVPFLFSSFAINAVSRAAFLLVTEVRRQFREIPGIMEGKNKPDYSRCVAISTQAAQKELLGPGILAVFTPILVGFALGFQDPLKGAAGLGGYLAGAILTGQLMAVFMSNTGGAWDNAKKKIEDGFLGGKGTDNHKAAVIGDTVGDPLKDTAGPALNPLIKVMNLVGILIAPIVISNISAGARAAVVIVALVFLAAAVSFSKRGGISEGKEVSASKVGSAR